MCVAGCVCPVVPSGGEPLRRPCRAHKLPRPSSCRYHCLLYFASGEASTSLMRRAALALALEDAIGLRARWTLGPQDSM